ncbi:ATP-binding protein [Teredinibacter turnerae]|uniref:ATP-binding protein n=1 Tax=Teredinibacter turnerae TaxID=2426 RepID=UPI00037FB0A7|nr:ATP-binding protein [Teredinibacter turnerae]
MDINTLNKLENEIFVLHRIFEEVFLEILRFIQYGRSDECLCVIGPTGVGKSKMNVYLVNYLVQQSLSGWRPDCHHPIKIEAPPKEKQYFPWRSFIEDLLLLLGERDIRRKVDLDEVEKRKRNSMYPLFTSALTTPQLQRALKLRINILKPSVILVDEAQNMVEGISEKERKSNANRLKYWANKMDTKFILFGTHESKHFINLNEQLSRRIAPIYFPRYSKTREGMERFAEFYLGLKSQLNLRVDTKIEDNFEDIYNYSLGCPGLLVTWIHHAISLCITLGATSITKPIWESQKMSATRLTTIERAIKNFEFELGKTKEEFNPDKVLPDERQVDLSFNLRQDHALKTQKGRPGQQKPKRHAVHEN